MSRPLYIKLRVPGLKLERLGGHRTPHPEIGNLVLYL